MDKNPERFQWLMIAVLQALGLIMLSQLNQSLSTLSLFLFIHGLFIAFPALFLPLGQGFATVVIFAIFYDSGESWNIGTSLVPCLSAFTIIYSLRNRIRYQRVRVLKMVILFTNFALFIYYTILAGQRFEFTAPFIFLNLLHLVVSQLVLQVVAGWLVSYHKQVLQMFRVDLESTLRAAK